jgi:hypothetical protein
MNKEQGNKEQMNKGGGLNGISNIEQGISNVEGKAIQ